MKCTISHFMFDSSLVNKYWILPDFVFTYGVQLLLTRQPVLWRYTGPQNFCALWELHCLLVKFIMIMSLSSCKFHNDIHDSKMEVAIIFWNFYSQPGFVLKEVEVVREKGESLKWTCAKRLCRKKAKMSNAVVVFLVCFCFFWKTFVWWKLNVIFMQSKKDNCWSDVCIAYKQILWSGKLLPSPGMFW